MTDAKSKISALNGYIYKYIEGRIADFSRKRSAQRTMTAPAAAAPAATPADPVLVAALTGEFSKVYGGRKLRAETVKGLVALFAGRGQPLVDVVQHVNWVEKHEAIWVTFWSKAFARAEMAACDDLDFATSSPSGRALESRTAQRRPSLATSRPRRRWTCSTRTATPSQLLSART